MTWIDPTDFVDGDVLLEEQLDAMSGDLRYLKEKSDAPFCHVHRSNSLAIANNVSTAVDFEAERHDSDGMWSLSLPSRIICNTDGYYLMGASCAWEYNTDGIRSLAIRMSGATILAVTQAQVDETVDPGSNGTAQTVVTGRYMQAGVHFIECLLAQSSGAPLDVQHFNDYSVEFWAVWQRP